MFGAFGGIYALKLIGLMTRARPETAIGLAAFLFGWPGVIPEHFTRRVPAQIIEPRRFFAAWTRTAAGAVSIVLLAVYAQRIPQQFLGLAGTAAILLTVHLGICDLLPWFWRWVGFQVPL